MTFVSSVLTSTEYYAKWGETLSLGAFSFFMHLPNCSKMNEENTERGSPLRSTIQKTLTEHHLCYDYSPIRVETRLMIREPNHNSKLFLAGKQS